MAANIVPMVTMNHWDLPQLLEDVGGWVNRSMVDYFTDFAEVLFDNFGDRVSTNIECQEFCLHIYTKPLKTLYLIVLLIT